MKRRRVRPSDRAMQPEPQWEAFAAREPYFAILTAPRFMRANLTPAIEREFFASGEHIVSWILGVIDAGLSPQFAPMSTLEYGCGVGRLALPLAQRAGSVTAVDRSPVMLELARREAERRDLGHIVFQTPAELFSTPRKFDLVVCYQVLQRLEPREGLALLDALIDRIAPHGVGVFQWPIRTRASGWQSASRRIRTRVPLANTLANALRGKPLADPFVPTHRYPLDTVLAAIDAGEFRTTQVAFEHDEHLDSAVLFAQRRDQPGRSALGCAPMRPDQTRGAGRAHGPAASEATDREIEQFNRAAETYFASLTHWEHHLAKPFSQVEETPTLLTSVAVLLQALKPTPGMTVLEFGAGSGWLSRFLSQMGCRVVLLDVSRTALEMARELYRRQPVVGDQPPPAFLAFDGRRIDLGDHSVDRIVCFDAFHHAPNPDTVLREFGRVLAPGGIAAFAEPGPRHAEAPRSQFESQTYGVVERDVDVHAVWRTARACGFTDLRMCVFHGTPHHVSLQEYEGLLAGGGEQEAWLASTRKFLRYVRNFYLVKGGTPRTDSRATTGLSCQIRASVAGTPFRAGEAPVIDATVTNTGSATWLASNAGRGAVAIGIHLYDGSGALLNFDFCCQPLLDPPREIVPGEIVRCRMTLPPLDPGTYVIELDCVAEHVTWFAQAGSGVTRLPVEIVAS